jgi:ribose transport system substrate-binding protein
MNKKGLQQSYRIVLVAIIAVGVVTCLAIPKGLCQEPRYQLDKDTAFDVFLKKHAWLEWWNNAPTIKQYKKNPPYKIGYITSWRGNPWQEVNIAEFKREVERSPLITDYVHMDSAGSVDTEISNLRDMFTMWKAGKLDAIIVDPLDAMALADTVAEIYNAGCPIITFNNAVNSTKYNCYVGNDPWTFGTLSAEWLAKELGYKGRILFFRGLKGYPIDLGRSGGGLSVFEKYPDIKVVAIEYADWSYDKAKKKFMSMVAAHPNFDAIYSVGGQMSNAITDAMLELGMDPSKYLHASEDQNGFMQKCIKHNIKAYASCHPSICSAISVVLMEMLLQGYPVPKMYFYPTPGIPSERFKDYVRPEAPEGIFVFTPLSDKLLNKIIK